MPSLVLALIAVYAIWFWLVHAIVTGADGADAARDAARGAERDGQVSP